MKLKTLDEVVAQMKQEVLDEIKSGRIPSTVRSFSELHDHIDANELGGFCDDEIADEMIAHFGGRDEHEGMPDGMMKFINDAQHAIDEWLELEQHLSFYSVFDKSRDIWLTDVRADSADEAVKVAHGYHPNVESFEAILLDPEVDGKPAGE